MANTQAICTSFKVESMNGIHAMGTTVARGSTAADVWKAALFLASATLNAATATYSTTGELAGTGNYTQGGVTFTWAAPNSSGTTAFTLANCSMVSISL